MNILGAIESGTSIIAIGGVFMLWLLSKNFVSKEELRAEVNRMEDNEKNEIRKLYKQLNEQALNIKELDTKMDILITCVNKISDHLIKRKEI